jgi:phosphoglycerate kinase
MNINRLSAMPKDQLSGRTVLVRVTAPDDLRPPDWLPTAAYLARAGANIIVASDGPLTDTQSVVSGLIPEIRTIDLAIEPGERSADEAFADRLADVCDVYCNDAFAVSHEVRASTIIVPRKVYAAVAGLAFEHELDELEAFTREPREPLLSILGGGLSKQKLLLAEDIARRSDHLLLAGRLCVPFLVAKGIVRDTSISDEMVNIADRMMTEAAAAKRFISTPEDFRVMDRAKFDRLQNGERFVRIPSQNVAEEQLQADHVICDIGEVARWHWIEFFGHVRRIFWHGPLGISEIDTFREGSLFLAEKLTGLAWPGIYRIVVCGRNLVSDLRRTDLPIERLRHLTTSGRAALHYLAGRPLPAVEALEAREPRRHRRRILIPLTGSEEDAGTLETAAELVPPNADVLLLHVYPGLDEERYPDFVASLTQDEKSQRLIEAKRIFAHAKNVLGDRGIFPSAQYTAQGHLSEVVHRFATRLQVELVVVSSRDREILYAAPATLVSRRY